MKCPDCDKGRISFPELTDKDWEMSDRAGTPQRMITSDPAPGGDEIDAEVQELMNTSATNTWTDKRNRLARSISQRLRSAEGE